MSKTVRCTTAEHEVMKADVTRLRIETRAPGRPQVIDDEIVFYFRECLRCFSTLTLEPTLETLISGGSDVKY